MASKYDGSKKRGPGRPCTKVDIVQLVVTMGQENPTWGYSRVGGMLKSLGHSIGRNTIKRILQDNGIEPVHERSKRTPWKTFLRAHWEGLAAWPELRRRAADFFTVEVLTLAGLVRYHVLFVIKLKTRKVQIAGVTAAPCEAWMTCPA